MGLPVTKCHLAKCNGVVGVISESVVKRNEEQINYNKFLSQDIPAYYRTYNATVSILQLYDTLKRKVYYGSLSKENANELLKLHVELLIFDEVVINSDRHAEGNLILVKDLQYKIKLRPIDNEMSLLSHFPTRKISEYLNSGKVEAIIKNEVMRTCGILSIKSRVHSNNNYLLNLTETKHFFPNLFEESIKKAFSLDLVTAINNVEKQEKTVLPKEYKEWITFAFNERLETIKEHFYDVDFIKPTQDDLEVN
jgi:hypothetical protein